MRIAWFRPAPTDPSDPRDDTAALISALRSDTVIDTFDARGAHDFVWQHARQPYDVCVYELADTPAHDFIWPYLFHYPGILRLRSTTLLDSRAGALRLARRMDDYADEKSFSGWRMFRAPFLASRLVVVADAEIAQALQDDYPEARIRNAPIGTAGAAVPVSNGADGAPTGPSSPEAGARRTGARADGTSARAAVRFGALETTQLAEIRRAAQRSRDAGAHLELLIDASPARVITDADVIIALRWPPDGEPPAAALAGMSAGLPVIVFEEAVTADWPALDPQTWQPRGIPPEGSSIVVSIDPRDEEHSLMLAMRRLTADAALRAQLGSAAYDWWLDHGTAAHAAHAWRTILHDAATFPATSRGLEPGAWELPPGWPAHLYADGGERLRKTLAAFGVSIDILP